MLFIITITIILLLLLFLLLNCPLLRYFSMESYRRRGWFVHLLSSLLGYRAWLWSFWFALFSRGSAWYGTECTRLGAFFCQCVIYNFRGLGLWSFGGGFCIQIQYVDGLSSILLFLVGLWSLLFAFFFFFFFK